MKKIFRHFVPLFITFFAAFIFFLGYNHYLLDASLANLKICLNDLDKATTLNDVKKLTSILDDSFLDELVKGDFDLAFSAKVGISQLIIDQGLKENIQAKGYTFELTSATNIDFAAVIAEKISTDTQISDIKHFIKEAINKEIKNRPIIFSFLEDIAIKLFPGQRAANVGLLKSRIAKLEKNLHKYKDEKLQDKYIEIAKQYLLLKDWDLSEQYFNKAIELNRENDKTIKAEFFLGVLYKAKKEFEKSAEIFNKIKDKLSGQWRSFAYYQEADCLYRSGQIDKAIALFEELFKLEPSLEIPQLSQFRAAYAYLYDLKEPARAQEAFLKIKKNEPFSDLSPYIEHKINPDMAWQYCKEGFQLLETGFKMSLDQKYVDALGKFDLALGVYPKHSTSYIGKALCFYFLKRPDDAIAEGIKAVNINPRDYEATANLGFIYFNLNKVDEAIEQYRKTINIYPASYIFNYNLATLYIFNKNYNLARIYFRKALNINPRYNYAYNNLGYVLWAQGNYNGAKDSLKKATALNSNYTEAYYNLGIIYFVLGNYEEARKEFMKVESLQPKFRRTSWYLKEIDLKLGYKAQ
ncbi:MAG: tetratricopeptide repeat protein [Candidatus Omnitrophica bacterium]|jgi:superkiller protein 3|nr:tetratricopeptide repeat protein [Candidatus Omnitrophota bacterium]